MLREPRVQIQRARLGGAMQALDWLTFRAGSALRRGDLVEFGFAFGKMLLVVAVIAEAAENA